MPQAHNDVELLAMITKDFLQITKDTSQLVLNDLKDEIELTVYDAFPESSWYQRNGEKGGFLGSWMQDTGMNGPNEIVGTVYSDPFTMILSEENYVHGSPFFGDQRPYMAENIIEGKNYDWGGNAAVPRDFWSDFEKWVTDGSLDAFFEGFMRVHGINFIKI